MERYWDCSLCKVEPKGEASRCRRCSGKLKGRDRLVHEVYGHRHANRIGAMLSAIAPGAGQFYRNRWLTGIAFAGLIPLCLGLLYITWQGFNYSHAFVLAAAIFVLIVAAMDSYFDPTELEAPCQRTCPAGLPIPDYLQLILDQEFEQGHALIRTRLPLVGIIGRVCPHPCEAVCYRGVDGEPIAINACKRYLADRNQKEAVEPAQPVAAVDGLDLNIGVVGAGPSGLSCAYYLAMLGASVTVYDTETEPGGRLFNTIPEFRLPSDILREEVGGLRRMGVNFRSSTRVGPGHTPLKELLDTHHATYLAVGAPESMDLNVEGAEAFVDFQDFLASAKSDSPMRFTSAVAVVGGGNAAIDVCRTALRCGAEEVHLLYRRSRLQMPARADEVEAAMREGIHFHYLVDPVRGVSDETGFKGVEVVTMELGPPDASGRPRPVPVQGSERLLAVEAVIPCLGQNVACELFDDPALAKMARDDEGRVVVHSATQRTNIAGLYAGGDVCRGPQTAVAAIADGRRAALTIFGDLAKGRFKAPRWRNLRIRKPFTSHVETPQEKIREEVRCTPLSERKAGFDEVERGFATAQAAREAKRCLQCHREL